MRVLIVEDDAAVSRLVRDQLESRGVGVISADSVSTGRDALARGDFHVVILDLTLLDGSGFEVLSTLRASGSSAHAIVLTDADAEADRVDAIERGADDVVVKPFFVRELAARVLAVERRRSITEETMLQAGPLQIDLRAHEVTTDGHPVDLTTMEFALLAFLAAHPGQAFSRAELLRAVWQSSTDWQQSATVTEHVSRLRTKIEADPRHPEMLITVRGAGYRFDAPVPQAPDAGVPETPPVDQSDGPPSPDADDLRRGLDAEEFDVYYQPVVALADGSLRTVEALVRWQHPVKGALGPDAFIETAEHHGLIAELGAFVLDTAARQVAVWRASGADVGLALNISAAELVDPELADRITASIEAAGLEPGVLWLEMTETSLSLDVDQAATTLDRLAGLGVNIAIDDFGTGWASLTYLSKFPIHALKIDRIFVAGIDENANDRAIAKSIVQLGADMGLAVVAEGIETVDQCEAAQALGCLLGQGYLFGRPTLGDDVPLHLAPRIAEAASTPTAPAVRRTDSANVGPRRTLAPAPGAGSINPAFVDELEEFLALIAAGRRRPAIAQALRLLDAGNSVEDLIVGLLAPAQREVDFRWQTHLWNTAQERAATAVFEAILGAVAVRTPIPTAARGAILVASVGDDDRSLADRIGAELLRCQGWDVIFLGGGVPPHDLAAFAASTHVDAVVLSCAVPLHLPGARRAIAAVEGLGIPVVAAGHGFGDTPQRASRLGASGWIGPTSNSTAVLAGLSATATGTRRERADEAVQLEVQADELRARIFHEMSRRISVVSSSSPRQLAWIRATLSDLLACLGVALDLGEPPIFDEFVAWLAEILEAGSVPTAVLDESLDIVAEMARESGFVGAAAACASTRQVRSES